MSIEAARKIISDNCFCEENSFVFLLHEYCRFSAEKFWEYYDSIAELAGIDTSEKDSELTMRINLSYQRILKEIIAHFDPNDAAVFENFPDNYNEYIERLDFAVLAYFSGDISLIDDKSFELQKWGS